MFSNMHDPSRPFPGFCKCIPYKILPRDIRGCNTPELISDGAEANAKLNTLERMLVGQLWACAKGCVYCSILYTCTLEKGLVLNAG